MNLLQAEWMKLRRLTVTWMIVVIPAVLALLGSTLPILSLRDAVRQFGSGITRAVEQFMFPQPLVFGLQIVDFLGALLVLIFITAVVGNEYNFDTWKNLLTRHPGHGRLLLVKLAYALILASIILVVVPLVFQAGTLIALGSALGLAPSTPLTLTAGDVRSIGALFATAWLRMAIAACIGLLATVVARSSNGGIAIAAPWLFADSLVNGLSFTGGLWSNLAPFTFNHNLGALSAYLTGGRGVVSLEMSLIVLTVYTLGFAALAVTLFRRRDIAG